MKLSSYDPDWNATSLREIARLSECFQGISILFHHIGSTAIPACKAKPVLDVLGIVSDVLEVDRFNTQLASLGYEAKGEFGMKRRRYFDKEAAPAVHLHIFEDTDPEVERHLRFRDYLRSHPDQVKAYSDLKERLAQKYPGDRKQYCLEKTPFIKEIDRRAAWESAPSERAWGPKRHFWTQEQIQESMEANMHLHMTYFAKYVPTQEIVFEPDVTVVRSEMADDTFNYVIGAHFNAQNASERTQAVINHFKKRSLPFSWWVGERDTPPELIKHLKEEGLSPKEQDFGMYQSLEKLPQVEHSLEIKRMKGSLIDFSNIYCQLGGYANICREYYDLIPPVLYREGAPFEMYVGYENHQAVTTGVLVMHANVAGIYYIMTLPSHRKKGYGTAMMSHLLHRAKDKGFHMATLQASEGGKNLYLRMGFHLCGQFQEFALLSGENS